MTIVVRTFAVAASPGAVLGYLKDFGNAVAWDRATRWTARQDTGPVTVGSSWHHVSKIRGLTTDLTYTLAEISHGRLVFIGRGEGATSVDTITVRPVPGGSEVTYHVDLEMHGLAKLVTPVIRTEFEKRFDETARRLTESLNRLASAA
jgi:hypothetical protein